MSTTVRHAYDDRLPGTRGRDGDEEGAQEWQREIETIRRETGRHRQASATKPFDLFVAGNESADWRRERDSNPKTRCF